MLKYHETSEYKLSQEIDEYSPTHFSDLEKDEQSKIASLWVAYKVDLTKDSGWFYDCLDHEYAVQLLGKLNENQAITLNTFRNTFLNEYYELVEQHYEEYVTQNEREREIDAGDYSSDFNYGERI
tara:strand:- start:52 stop:426 length:375 start_codon:yes stop_codon:yes gene_type:complete